MTYPRAVSSGETSKNKLKKSCKLLEGKSLEKRFVDV